MSNQISNTNAAPQTELFSVDGKYANFRLTVTDRTKCTISGKVEEVTSWSGDGNNTPCEFDHYLKFYIKWDGCSHVWFGEEQDGETDGYLHLCGAESWTNHIALMKWLYEWAEKTIPMDKSVSGDLS